MIKMERKKATAVVGCLEGGIIMMSENAIAS